MMLYVITLKRRMVVIISEIVLYSTGCPRCDVLKRKLGDNNIQYTECNDTEKMLSVGIIEVPVLKVDNNLLGFSDAIKWINQK